LGCRLGLALRALLAAEISGVASKSFANAQLWYTHRKALCCEQVMDFQPGEYLNVKVSVRMSDFVS
jgi:hypothetical protein